MLLLLDLSMVRESSRNGSFSDVGSCFTVVPVLPVASVPDRSIWRCSLSPWHFCLNLQLYYFIQHMQMLCKFMSSFFGNAWEEANLISGGARPSIQGPDPDSCAPDHDSSELKHPLPKGMKAQQNWSLGASHILFLHPSNACLVLLMN